MTDDLQQTPLDGNEQDDIQSETTPDASSSESDRRKWESETKRARKDAEKYRQQARDAQAQAAQAETQLSQLAAVQEKLTSIEQKLADAEKAQRTAELQAIRLQVVASVGLPPDLAEFVKGETQEEILASAQKLAEKMPKGSVVVPRVGQGADVPPVSRVKEELARIHGTSNDIFNPDIVRATGGGIIKGK